MDCGKLVRRVVGDPDETFSYRTSRTLVIKDWRVGISLLGLQFGVFCYICLYQIYSQQVYFAESDITGAVRLNPRAPAPAFSWNNGAAPFCSGATGPFTHPSTLISSYYTIVNDNNYTYTGPGSSGAGVIFPRYPCTYMDEANAIPLFEDDRLLIVTEQGPGAQGCTWRPVTGDLGNFFDLYTYVPDIEFYTIQFDHQVNAPQARVAKSVIDMRGTLRDSSGRIVDPCVGYTSFGLTCPGFVRIGVENRPDIVPVSTLLIAAGINTLDAVSGSDEFGSSRRSQGVVLIVDISYSNYCQGNILTVPGAPPVGGTGNCNTQDDVQYTYRVFAVPRTQFQISGTSIPANIFPIPTAPPNVRTAFRKYGLRIITTQSGRIGYFLFQTLLVNLVVSLGLMSVGIAIIEFVIFSSLCPLRGLFRQLKERDTVSITQLRNAGKARPSEYKNLIQAYNTSKENLTDPHPEDVLKVLSSVREDKTSMELSPVKSSSGVNAWGETKVGNPLSVAQTEVKTV